MTKACQRCGRSFSAERSTAKWCSNKCRQGATPAVAAGEESAKPHQPGPLELVVLATLDQLDMAGTVDAECLLRLARLAEDPTTPGSAVTGAVTALQKLDVDLWRRVGPTGTLHAVQ